MKNRVVVRLMVILLILISNMHCSWVLAQNIAGKPLIEFDVVVSLDFENSKQLSSFSRDSRKKFTLFNDTVNDINFKNVSVKLLPGVEYHVALYGVISDSISSEECLAFVKKQPGALLVGAQGLTYIWQEKGSFFPKNRFTLSFDEKKGLWYDGQDQRVPWIGSWNFGAVRALSMGHFNQKFFNHPLILCVTKK